MCRLKVRAYAVLRSGTSVCVYIGYRLYSTYTPDPAANRFVWLVPGR